MAENEFCQGCYQNHNCRRIYQAIGNIKGPTVIYKVISAFLVPMLAFIVSLAGFERILAKTMAQTPLRTVTGFILALSVTFLCILIIRLIRNYTVKDD